MLNLLSAAVILPLLGAGAIFLASLLLCKLDAEKAHLWTLAVASGIALATFVLVSLMKGSGGSTAVLAPAQLSALAGSAIGFHLEPALWSLALGLSLGVSSSFLAELARNPPSSPRLAAVSLGLLALSLGAVWSANPFTMIVIWALYDLLLFQGLIVAGAGRAACVRSLAFGTAANLLVWAGVVVAGDGTGNVQWPLMPPGGPKMTFWMLAGLLRIGAYPFHLSAPARIGTSPPLTTALFLSPVIGWGLWVRLVVVNGGVPPVGMWALVPALLTMAAGGLLGWTARRAGDVRPFIATGANGAVLLSSTWLSLYGGGQGTGRHVPLAVVTLGVTAWVLGVSILFLGGGRPLRQVLRWPARLRMAPSLIGALSLIGAPMTLGFVAESYLLRAGQWGPRIGFLLGRTLLVAAVGRWLSHPLLLEQEDVAPLRHVAHGVGVMAPAVSLVVAGLAPTLLLPGAPGLSLRDLLAGQSISSWLLWVAALLLGAVLVWYDDAICRRASRWLDAVHDLVLLEWAYRLVTGAFEQGLALVRTIDDILGGRGALLWSLVLFLILILVWRGR